ncbi:hypothetical protein Tco_0377647 [Tanacetum coccineum]
MVPEENLHPHLCHLPDGKGQPYNIAKRLSLGALYEFSLNERNNRERGIPITTKPHEFDQHIQFLQAATSETVANVGNDGECGYEGDGGENETGGGREGGREKNEE